MHPSHPSPPAGKAADHPSPRADGEVPGSPAPLPTVGLVIPVYKGGEAFVDCLEAVAEMRPAPDDLVVVVDGEQSRGEDEVARRYGARVLHMGTRAGPAAARNTGAAATATDVLLFLDADVRPSPTAVTETATYFATHPDVHAIIGSYDDGPPERNFPSQYKNLLNHYMHQRARVEGHTFWGACGAVRREVFAALDGFVESYGRPCIEDIEFGYRLRAAGGRIHVVKALQVTHLKRWTWKRLLRTDFFFRALPWSELILLTRHMENDLNVDVVARVKVVLIYLAVLSTAGALVVGGGPAAAGAVAVFAGAALALDWPLWRFFIRRRGVWFSLRTVPWHVFYHLYSGAAFALAAVRHLATTRRRWRAKRLGEGLRGHTAVRLPADPPDRPSRS